MRLPLELLYLTRPSHLQQTLSYLKTPPLHLRSIYCSYTALQTTNYHYGLTHTLPLTKLPVSAYSGYCPITSVTAQPALRHIPGYAIWHSGVRPIERCLFLHSRRLVTAQNRYQTNSSKRSQVGFSSLKKRKRRARKADHLPKRRVDATASDRDASKALKTSSRTTAVATLIAKKNEKKSADAERTRPEALAEA